jgi:hypothetical protein
MIKALILGLVIGALAFATLGRTSEVTFENCQPGTWIGGVRWFVDRTGYEQIPELELKQSGSITVELTAGDYAITHFRPVRYVKDSDGQVFPMPAAIIGFRNITVPGETTHSFGCEE